MNVHEILRQHHLRPRKGLGQHFLVDEVHLARIVAAAELTKADVVLEIGPGLGTLTERLAEAAGRVIAVELDSRMVAILAETLAGRTNVHIVHGDILSLDPAQLVTEGPNVDISSLCPSSLVCPISYKVVANLPYYITSAVIRHLLEARLPPSLMVLTVQREVAQRMIARPPEMNLLAISVQLYASVEIVDRIPAGAFYPAPKVDSAVVRLRRYERPAVDVTDVESFFEVVKAGFGQRRKQLRNALASGLGRSPASVAAVLRTAQVDPHRRAETLTLEEWARLARAVDSLPAQC
ncbi:MAG: 16S rRNA (adenine(1518)-N(6)/adenine(1519)-N(6))-dimethyltransferase RsmA [Anaerolineae bacterium]|nr:16S rRNA (adenine(1518)-N(6)/adenine(1519)-N(6))-dimethyltransferase RsmA [Anaerolineae bacterium]MDW8099837.1 16S rRNA (adenine(1518)-N(6)/adenine(1519)-N(6))-dimethyltransferase RsmA [Anaerolineae bacterium]